MENGRHIFHQNQLKKNKLQKKLVRSVLILGAIVLLIVFFFGDHGVYQLYRLREEKAEIQQSIVQLREEKKRLESEEAERQRKIAETLAIKEQAKKKLEELKKSPVGNVVTKKTIGTLGGTAIGAALGTSLGVAGKFLGVMVFINGAWVLAPLGGALGYWAAKKLNKKRDQQKELQKIQAYGEKINKETREK